MVVASTASSWCTGAIKSHCLVHPAPHNTQSAALMVYFRTQTSLLRLVLHMLSNRVRYKRYMKVRMCVTEANSEERPFSLYAQEKDSDRYSERARARERER